MENKKRVCCILNFAPHYRTKIFQSMEGAFNCVFYFGSATFADVKKMDYTQLQNYKRELPFIRLYGHWNWLDGAVSKCFHPYTDYILTGEPFCLSTWVVMILNRFLGKRTFLWSHGWYGSERGFKRWVKKAFFSLSHGVLLYGEYAKALMVKEGFAPKKLHVIYNSLDFFTQSKLRDTSTQDNPYVNHFKNDNPVLVFIGRLEAGKHLELLVEAMYILTKEYGNVNLAFIGGGKQQESLSALVQSKGLASNVWFYGTCYNESEIAPLLYHADLCVSPGFVGLTAIHTMTYGTPVVTHNNFSTQMPEFETIEPGVTGAFFGENSVSDLVFTIKSWLESAKGNRTQIRNRCISRIEKHYNSDYQIEIIKKALQIEGTTN